MGYKQVNIMSIRFSNFEEYGRFRILKRSLFTVFLVVFIAFLSPIFAAEDWPQWRGPSGNGVSSSKGLPVNWNADEHIAWKVSLAGLGASSPVFWGDTIFVTSQKGIVPIRQGMQPQLARDDPSLADQENPIGGRNITPDASVDKVTLVVEAFRRSNGKKLWEYIAPATGEFPNLHEKHNLASPTPVTDGKLVFALFGTGQIVALDFSGKEIWSRHLGKEYSPFTPPWGHGASPVLYKETLILLCDHPEKSYLLALDKTTGKERWKVDRGQGRVSHSTPLVVPGPEGDELIVNSSERVDAFNPENGELLWYAGSRRQTPVPSPAFHKDVIYISRGYRNSPFFAIRAGGHGNADSNILWSESGGASYVPSILYYQGLLYVTNEVGVVTCVDAETGKSVWRKRLGGIFFASPVAGDGKVYMVSETGETYVLKAGREADILAQNDLGERFLASPAISDGRLFLRSDHTLFCIGD
jgi:outer membrane protein assembly factor BamB